MKWIYKAIRLVRSRAANCIDKGWNHDRNDAARGGVFIGRLVNEHIVFAHNGCTVDGNGVCGQIDFAKGHGKDLGTAKAVKRKQRGNLERLSVNKIDEAKNFVRLQPRRVSRNELRKAHVRRRHSGMTHRCAQKAPCIF